MEAVLIGGWCVLSWQLGWTYTPKELGWKDLLQVVKGCYQPQPSLDQARMPVFLAAMAPEQQTHIVQLLAEAVERCGGACYPGWHTCPP